MERKLIEQGHRVQFPAIELHRRDRHAGGDGSWLRSLGYQTALKFSQPIGPSTGHTHSSATDIYLIFWTLTYWRNFIIRTFDV